MRRAGNRYHWHTVLAGASALIVLSVLAAAAQTPRATEPAGRAEAIVRAQMVLAEQNREETLLLTLLGVVVNVLVLPLGMAVALAAAGWIHAGDKSDASAAPRIAPWVLLGAVVWLDLAVVGQAALSSSVVTRFHYGAYISAQARQELAVPEEALLSKPEYADRHPGGAAKLIFDAAYAAPAAAALLTAISSLALLRRRPRPPGAPDRLQTAWASLAFLTLITLAIALPQAYIAATSTARS